MNVYNAVLTLIVGFFFIWALVKSTTKGRITNIKWWFCLAYLKLFYKRPKRFQVWKHNQADEPARFFPSEVEKNFELPRLDIFDAVSFSGTDAIGNSITMHLTRCPHRRASVWLILNIKESGVFELPMHPETNVYNVDAKTFSAAGLKCEVQEPMRRWRISYNGLMKKRYNDNSSDTNELCHVRFTFIWTAITSTFNYNEEISTTVMADMLAKETWSREMLQNLNSMNTFSQYDQWGQLYGIVNIDGGDEMTMHLRGLRMRSFGTLKEKKQTHVDIQVYMQDGIQIHVAYVGPINGFKRLRYGCVFKSNGAKYPITWTDLSPLSNKRRPLTSVSFVTREGKHTLHIDQTTVTSRLFVGKERQGERIIQVAKFTLQNKVEGWGFVTFSQMPFQNENNSLSVASPLPCRTCVTLLEPVDLPLGHENDQLVVDCASPYAASVKHVGGKGLSLTLLNRLQDKFVVPAAVFVTSVAFFDFLDEATESSQFVHELEDVAWKRKDGNLQVTCQKVVDTMCKAVLPEKIKHAIHNKLEQLVGVHYENIQFAVRSSAIGEDSDELSAAGQNDTYLGVSGLECICEAVIKCWASQFTYMATEYKRQHGQLLNPGMAVVIQKMVRADASAVMFTRDPNTGNPSRMIITANYGLGESIVAASAEPDTIVLNRTFDDQLSIHKKLLGSKTSQTVLAEAGGTSSLAVEHDSASSFSLTDELCLELGRIGQIVENSFGSARDIECCVADNQIYLLQARPITSFDHPSDFEIMHEFDSPIKTDHEHFTKANTGEVYPNATTPLTVSVVVKLLDGAVQSHVASCHPPGQFIYNYNWTNLQPTAYNHVLLNCIDLFVHDSGGVYSDTFKIVELAVCGHILGYDAMYKVAGERFRGTESSRLRFCYNLLKELIFNKSVLCKMSQRVEDFPFSVDKASAADLHASISHMFLELFKYCSYHCKISSASTFWNVVAVLVLTEGNTEWSEGLYADIATLLGSCPDVESSQVPHAMKALAQAILEDEQNEEFISDKNLNTATLWLKNHNGKPGMIFRKFLETHGHRCVKEFDLHSCTWKMDPSTLVQILQNMTKNPKQISAPSIENQSHESTSISQTLDQLTTHKKYLTKKILAWILPQYRAAVSYREASKSILIKSVDKFRRSYRTLANMMVRNGFLPDEELLFFLTHNEIGEILTTRSAKLLKRASLRKRLHNTLVNLRFPEVIVGLPKPVQDEEDENCELQSSMQISGTPVCHGVVQGVARVVTCLDEASNIQPNDILIVYCTDIGWSPYFPLLSGVVTEIGGIVSHGAVVAREYGLPCIVGAQNATRLFKSGDQVILDGGKGILQKLS